MSRKLIRPLAISSALVLTMGMAACSSDSGGGSGASSSVDCSAFSSYGDLSGTTVSVYTAIVSPEADPYVDSFKATPRNLTVLVYDRFGLDLKGLGKQVQEALNLLEAQSYVQRNGNIYDYLTNE